ncbi:tRNA uracil 4-sulfurtransferase ThiI [Thermogutta sp.]|uniref:tRNA uracil 4-sulfurtransferase ThiI n=1 Tax=Thermogutta sp. TaxID=1962930 RepID=UPI003C7A38A6
MKVTDAPFALLMVRPSAEFTLKSNRTRRRLQQALIHNLTDALESHGLTYRISGAWNTYFVETTAPGEAAEVLCRVAGIGSIVPIARVSRAEVDEIVRAGVEAFAEVVQGKRFAVRARRTGTHPFRSRDVEVALGAGLRPFAQKVDLTQPEVTVHVDIQDSRAFLYAETLRGLGGLPIGSQGKALVLISGGFDSAVAAWLIMRRGVAVDYVFCNLGGKAYERAVIQVAKVLADNWSYGTHPRFYSIDFTDVIIEMRQKTRSSYWQIVLKRLMYGAGSLVARRSGAVALVTGESIGQVSSQTLKNLAAIEAGSDLPILRPLLTYDKEDIIHLARRIGTATLSERVREYCALTPDHPVTGASPETLDREMAKIDLGVLHRAVERVEEYDLRSLSTSAVVLPYLFTETIPSGAEIIDCQPESAYRQWHYPGARHMDPWDLLKQFNQLDRNRVYVLYCPQGLQTAYVAEVMQRAGYEAYSFKGGTPALRTYCENKPAAAVGASGQPGEEA